MRRALLSAALCASAQAAGPTDGLTVGSETVPFGESGGGGAGTTSATVQNSIANLGMWHPPFNRAEASHVSIVCYQFEGIRCQAITRGHSDSVTSLYMEKNSGTTVHEVTLTTVASTQPSVTALDETNAIACYTRDSDWHLFCHSLHLEYGPDKNQPEWVLSAGAAATVHNSAAVHINVAAWDGRGPPASWQSKRALVCYSAYGTSGRPAECRALSVTYADAHRAGVVAAHSATTIVAAADANSINSGYPGVRFFDQKSLTVFDHFNAMICYTTPSVFEVYECLPQQGSCPVPYWYYGSGNCVAVSTDLATGTELTKGASQAFGSTRVTDVSISAFRPKSGDPTRALLCWITVESSDYTFDGSRRYYDGVNKDLKCQIVTRQGTSFIFTDSKRESTTYLASAGGSTEIDIYQGDTTAALRNTALTYVKDVTLTAIDEYNQLVCWTYGAYVPQCTWTDARLYHRANAACQNPTTGNDRYANGIRLGTGNGKLMCRQLWITGYGSSTYNSKEYDGVASASGPKNVGQITSVNSGPVKEIESTPVSDPYLISYDQYLSLICYTKKSATPNRAGCKLIGTVPALSDPDNNMKQVNPLWSFNAPIDCVNGYNCPNAAMTLAERQAASTGRRLEDAKPEGAKREAPTGMATALKAYMQEVGKGMKTALKAAKDTVVKAEKAAEKAVKETAKAMEGQPKAGMVNITGS